MAKITVLLLGQQEELAAFAKHKSEIDFQINPTILDLWYRPHPDGALLFWDGPKETHTAYLEFKKEHPKVPLILIWAHTRKIMAWEEACLEMNQVRVFALKYRLPVMEVSTSHNHYNFDHHGPTCNNNTLHDVDGMYSRPIAYLRKQTLEA